MYCPVGSSDLDSLDLNFLTLFLAWAALALTHTILRMIKTNYFYDHYRSRNPQLVETTVSKPQAGSKLQRLWLLCRLCGRARSYNPGVWGCHSPWSGFDQWETVELSDELLFYLNPMPTPRWSDFMKPVQRYPMRLNNWIYFLVKSQTAGFISGPLSWFIFLFPSLSLPLHILFHPYQRALVCPFWFRLFSRVLRLREWGNKRI